MLFSRGAQGPSKINLVFLSLMTVASVFLSSCFSSGGGGKSSKSAKTFEASKNQQGISKAGDDGDFWGDEGWPTGDDGNTGGGGNSGGGDQPVPPMVSSPNLACNYPNSSSEYVRFWVSTSGGSGISLSPTDPTRPISMTSNGTSLFTLITPYSLVGQSADSYRPGTSVIYRHRVGDPLTKWDGVGTLQASYREIKGNYQLSGISCWGRECTMRLDPNTNTLYALQPFDPLPNSQPDGMGSLAGKFLYVLHKFTNIESASPIKTSYILVNGSMQVGAIFKNLQLEIAPDGRILLLGGWGPPRSSSGACTPTNPIGGSTGTVQNSINVALCTNPDGIFVPFNMSIVQFTPPANPNELTYIENLNPTSNPQVTNAKFIAYHAPQKAAYSELRNLAFADNGAVLAVGRMATHRNYITSTNLNSAYMWTVMYSPGLPSSPGVGNFTNLTLSPRSFGSQQNNGAMASSVIAKNGEFFVGGTKNGLSQIARCTSSACTVVANSAAPAGSNVLTQGGGDVSTLMAGAGSSVIAIDSNLGRTSGRTGSLVTYNGSSWSGGPAIPYYTPGQGFGVLSGGDAYFIGEGFGENGTGQPYSEAGGFTKTSAVVRKVSCQ